MNNIIFYFTGTGNSLKVARDIGKNLENCEIQLVTNFQEKVLKSGYDRIGFVFPVYAANIPNCFIKFLSEVDFTKNKDAYFFAVSTQGGYTGNSLFTVDNLLKKQNIELNGAFNVKMFSNNVVLYNMGSDPIKTNEKSNIIITKIANQIKEKEKTDVVLKERKIWKLMSNSLSKSFKTKDKFFNVSENCNSCGTCKKICPAKNIDFSTFKPTFLHKCEQVYHVSKIVLQRL